MRHLPETAPAVRGGAPPIPRGLLRRVADGLRVGAAGTLLAAACGGGSETTPTTPDPAPPALDVPFSSTDVMDGDGIAAESGWLLAIAYTGWIYEPSAADNKGTQWISIPADTPLTFRLGIGQVIAGVDEGLLGMRVGGTRRLVIPPDMAFGEAGNSLVPGNATIILEIELIAADEVPFSTTDLVLGEGDEAVNGDYLEVAYSGWIYDLIADGNKGHLFDSAAADSAYFFTLGAAEVIIGWDLGVLGMRVGGRRRLVLPHQLAYGAEGNNAIPEYATLLFEVELLAIN